MQATTYSQAALLNLQTVPDIARLIEENLTHDWILRVEHSGFDDGKTMYRKWEQWGDSSFAITDPSPVIDNIIACRASYPDHSVRLNAEKVRPRTQFYYWLYTPEQDAGNELKISHDSAVTPGIIKKWLLTLGNSARTAKSRVWRILTLAAMLLASMLMLEEVMA